jgi:Tfp pilus assembly protein PilV
MTARTLQHSTSRSRRPRHAPPSRRAITLLEVILAVLILSLSVAAVTMAISAILGMESSGRKRVEAYEVANRLLLQYLDDKSALPSDALPIAYGDHRYFWSLDKTPTRMVINRKQESSGAALQATDRFSLVGVTVFDSEQVRDLEVRGEPIAFISRVVDPAAPRNPDTLSKYDDPRMIEEMLKETLRLAPETYSTATLRGRQLR